MYDVYMGSCLLPVAPEKIQIKVNSKNSRVTLMNDGEINMLKRAGLTDIEFECEIPQVRHPYASYKSGFRDAGYFMGAFEALKSGRRPFQFIVCRRLPSGRQLLNTSMRVSLEDYTVTEDARNGFDFKVKVKLKQWRDYGTKMVRIKAAASGASASASPQMGPGNSRAPAAQQSYTVARGDCLFNIAKRFYGDGAMYPAIYEANRETIGGNPNRIYAGQVLTIPALQ